VNGIGGRSRPPSASATALVTAHSAPASPTPLTPSGLNGEGVSHSIIIAGAVAHVLTGETIRPEPRTLHGVRDVLKNLRNDAVRRYNGSGPDPYNYQARILRFLLNPLSDLPETMA